MEISVHVLLYILILISGKARNGICISQKEERIISKRQIDLLPVGTEVHIKARQSTKRPQCLQNEHGPNCTYCVARDTCEEGHFTCDVRTGNKICLPGYQGQNCRISTKHASNYYDVTCPENTCRNGGSCASGHCCCREGFTGILCEIEIIECKNNSCLNGGICKDLIGKYECLCKPTFRGKNCEIPVSTHVQTTPSRDSGCQSNSCRNNGTCLEDTFLTYCLCPTYYTGEQCETHIGTSSGLQNSCPENYFGLACRTFCKPQDSCFGHYVCDKSTGGKICMGGWHGQHCDTRNLPQRVDPDCPNHGCKNDGQCFHNGCCCRNNYTGDNCQIESIGCLSNPCKNNATCTNQGNGFICECLQSFTGKMCENDIKYSTIEPKATDTQNTHSAFHAYTFSAAASNVQHFSSSFTDHISSKYPMPSFTSTLALPNVIHSLIKSSLVLPPTEIPASNQISVVYTDISNSISNHLTGKSESHISGTESRISPTLTLLNTSPSSLYFDSVTTYSQLSSSTITARQSHLKSISVEILPSQGTLPMSLLGITSKPYGNMRTRSSSSNFISFSKSFETSSFMYIPKYSSSTSLNILITSTFDSSLSVKDGTMSEHIDRFSANTLSSEFVGIHTSKVRISPTVVDPSFSDHTDSNTLLLSSFDSLSLSRLVATSAPVSTNMLETSILYKTSTKRFPASSKSSVSSVDSAYISSSSNTISVDINSAHVFTTTPPISFSFSETTPFIHQNSLSDSIPIIRESTIQKTTNLFTSNVDNTKFTNIVVSPDHTSTSTSHNILPTTVHEAALFTSTQMSTYINNMDRDSSEYMSTMGPTTKINIVPTPSSVSYHNIDYTVVSSIKPSFTIKPSDSAMDRLSTFSLNGVSSAVDSVIPTLSGTVRTFSETSMRAMPYSDSMVLDATDIKTIAGINSKKVMHLENHETRIYDSLYISPTSASSTSSTTSYISHSSSLHTNIHSSSIKSNNIVTTSSKIGSSITTSYIAVAPATSSSISSNSGSSGRIVTMGIVKTAASSIVPNTATAKTTSRIHASTKASSSLHEKPTVSLAPTSFRHSANAIQSTDVDFVSPTMLITDLNSESNEGISKSWRIALIVIGCVLFVIAVIFLIVFLSVRQRRKDSRTISQSPADIQDYSKEHFSEQPDFHNPTYEIENDSDDDSVKYDIYVVNE
ncbi:uncharacterized protein LOC123543133 [Mercenaria mercenaria]|uniref:uncharacterized protein LOC123543133 n=1 Tax=Mercenaria mercenaria TaxID=6596 RepID=UPI00234F483B|nr:uncharacterized protein LOC123543133 [Mercenaria mercenaria]